MKLFDLRSSLLLLLLIVAAAGCEPDSAPDASTAANASENDSTIVLEGDFQGPLGLQLWSLRTFFAEDVPGTLARVREMGFQEVELAGLYGMSPAAFREELDRAGLTASSMHASYDRLRDSLEVVLDEAETLDVDYVGVAWIPHPDGEPFTDAMAREAAAHFNTWGAAAQERGLQFFYHIHGYEFQPTPEGIIPFDVMVQETTPDVVDYEIDVFWATHPGQDPVALLRKYPDRWKLMHVKDMKQGTPTNNFSGRAAPEDEVPVGTGLINYPEVLKAAQEIGLERYYIEDETLDPLGNIPQSVRFMETVTF